VTRYWKTDRALHSTSLVRGDRWHISPYFQYGYNGTGFTKFAASGLYAGSRISCRNARVIRFLFFLFAESSAWDGEGYFVSTTQKWSNARAIRQRI
jgi:hypothetical protein